MLCPPPDATDHAPSEVADRPDGQPSRGRPDAPQLGPGCSRLPRCEGRLRLIALVEDSAVIQRVLRHPVTGGQPACRGGFEGLVW